MITVISTGYRTDSGPCAESVREQSVVATHAWIDASSQTPVKTCPENLLRLVQDLPPDSIVAWVDLDDRLARKDALHIAEWHHNQGAWVTYGSFAYADGRKGFASPYRVGESFRTSAWRATHLKTFRAGLLQRVKPEHFKWGGMWINRAVDMAVMMPVLEMAGHDRVKFIPDVLLEYNFGASFEFNASPQELTREKMIDQYVRGLPAYERLESL